MTPDVLAQVSEFPVIPTIETVNAEGGWSRYREGSEFRVEFHLFSIVFLPASHLSRVSEL